MPGSEAMEGGWREPNQRPILVERLAAPFEALRPSFLWFEVPGDLKSSGQRRVSGTEESIPLVLTRISPPPKVGQAHEYRTPVLLLHGFAQSSRAFVAEPLEEDLVRHLLKHDFDVWLLDYRLSTALPSARRQYTLDHVAEHDIPEAVDRILSVAGRKDNGWPPPGTEDGARPQVLVFGHCMGSATVAMSMLSGMLQYREDGARKIGALVLSQVPPLVVGGIYSQWRRQLAAVIRDVLGVDGVNLAADDGASALEVMADRLFATLPFAEDEYCPHEYDRAEPQTGIATCKRVSGIIGPLYRHVNVQKTHGILHQYFGWGSVSVFAQIGKVFEYERLVSADGVNHYVTDARLKKYMDLPVAFLHGTENKVFDPLSAERSLKRLRELHANSDRYREIPAKGYAHFDCLIGDRAHIDVFPQVSAFLKAHRNACAVPLPRADDSG
jgi:pimeloyl-ACP methyl ester carboxylesterase